MFPPEISICFSFAFLRGIEVGVFYNVNREIDHGRKNVADPVSEAIHARLESLTSPTCGPMKAGSTWPSCSTCSTAKSSAGRSSRA